jgi:NAD+ synthase (glutamine-hydrolysing)
MLERRGKKNMSQNNPSLRIALAQLNPTVGDMPGNRQMIVDSIRRAKAREADMVIFSELMICGYPPEDLLFKDHFVRDNLKVLRSLLKETKGMAVIVGFIDTDGKERLYNAAAVICDGTLKGVYRKEELPNYGVFDEKRYFQPGRNNKLFSMNGICFGVSVCEDIWKERGVCIQQADRGARLLINISCSPYDVGKLRQRERLLKRRAQQTNAYVCYVNLVGGQDELVFDGGSLVIDPQGKTVASAKQFEEDLLVLDLNIKSRPGAGMTTSGVIVVRKNVIPQKTGVMKHRQSKRLTQKERIYSALVLGTRDYARKNGFQKAVLGLSGGIDSSLVAVLAADALGIENVIGVTMPSRFTSKWTKVDAHRTADNLGIRLIEFPIEKIFKTYLAQFKAVLTPAKFGLAEENLQARIRGDILMTLSNRYGWLVLTTGNKSEVAVGYCTLYGDMTGGFAIIKDVPKTMVYELAQFRNGWGKTIIPDSVLKRAPTAELRAYQRDQDSLPPYDILDNMLKEYVEQHWSLSQMARRRPLTLIKKVVTMVDRSEYKRRQAPPGIKISPRAFGKDWRLPITNKYREF